MRLWHLPSLAVRVVGRIRGAAVGAGVLRGRSLHSRGSEQNTYARHAVCCGIADRRNYLGLLVVRAAGSLPEVEKLSGADRVEAFCQPIKRLARVRCFDDWEVNLRSPVFAGAWPVNSCTSANSDERRINAHS